MLTVGRLLVLVLALTVSGCSLIEAQFLSIDQAVARLVPNDPPGMFNANHFIGEMEIQRATQLWVQGKPVPMTGGQTITEKGIEHLIMLWQRKAPVL